MIADLIADAMRAFIEAITREGLVRVDGHLYWRTSMGTVVQVTSGEIVVRGWLPLDAALAGVQ